MAELGAYLDGYIEGRRDEVAKRTIGNFMVTADKLKRHFGPSRAMRSITAADADDWRQSLFARLSAVSIAGHVKRAKQFFRHAQRRGFIETNPFADLVAGSQANDSRKVYVERADIDAVIEHAPDPEWKLLIALARYGGLRTPSESLQLRWDDINWAKGRFLVHASKTKLHKPTRGVPIFPELEPFLLAAAERAPEGAVYCIERYRSQNANLRTQLERYIKATGISPWPRLWQTFERVGKPSWPTNTPSMWSPAGWATRQRLRLGTT